MDLQSPLYLPEDPKEARKIFNALPLEHQLDLLLQARGGERTRTLFLSDHPEQLIQRLPELEIFLTVKEADEKDSIDWISLTTPEQFQYLLDLDLWKKDRLDPEKILRWMEVLLECGAEKVAQFIHAADPGLIVLILKGFLRTRILEGEPVEEVRRFSLFTLDQHYFIVFISEEARKTLQPFVESLYHVSPELYRRIMDSLGIELESELEEIEYRLRNGRLADSGFPDFEEALEIYKFVNPDSVGVQQRILPARQWGEVDEREPTFYLTFQYEGPFFSSVLSKIEDPAEQARLKQEITSLCNKAIIAESLERFTPEEMGKVTRKAFHYLNLGLQYLSKEDETEALALLRSLPIQKIFQCGVGATLLLRKKANAILSGPWFGGDPENLVLLDPPYSERFGGLLRKRPALYRNRAFGDFETVRDLRETDLFLGSVETVVNSLGKELDVYPRGLRALDLTSCYPKDWREITLSTIFLTALANQVLQGVLRFEPIERARLKDLLPHMFHRDEEGKRGVKMEIKRNVREWLDSIETDEDKRKHLLAFWDFCFDLFEEEFGRLSLEEEIDPRYVKGLLVQG